MQKPSKSPFEIALENFRIDEANRQKEDFFDGKQWDTLNEPKHYHEHDMDTIEFLKRGFPPAVLTGFLIGNIIKYTQRFEYKNGEDDLVKVVDYSKRLQEWYKETHSK